MKDYEYDRKANPFQPSAKGYHSNNALCLACAANLAYMDEADIAPVIKAWGFSQFRFFDHKETQAFVCGNSKTILVSFRGTEPSKLKDWMSDLKARKEKGPVGKVHRGFKGALNKVWPDVTNYVSSIRTRNQKLWFTGHSLGAALATLAAARTQLTDGVPVQGLYTFGHPRTGDQEFAQGLDSALSGLVYRFVNNNDVVPRVPLREMGYRHVGRFVYFTQKRTITNRISVWERRLDRVKGRISDLGKPGTDGIKDHDMSRYVRLVRKNQHVALHW
jgi:triacylglycerol lipase